MSEGKNIIVVNPNIKVSDQISTQNETYSQISPLKLKLRRGSAYSMQTVEVVDSEPYKQNTGRISLAVALRTRKSFHGPLDNERN
jgi:hypothetical protein